MCVGLCMLGSVHASMLTCMLVSLRYLIVEVLTILGYAKGIRDVGQQATLHIYLLALVLNCSVCLTSSNLTKT